MLNALILLAQQGAEKAAEAPSPLVSLAPLLIIIVLFYFMFIVPQRRERRAREGMYDRLKKNDRVVTSAGIFGYVVNIKDNEVSLRIDDNSNTRLTVLKSSIAQILTPEDQSTKESTDKAAASTAENVKAGAPPKG